MVLKGLKTTLVTMFCMTFRTRHKLVNTHHSAVQRTGKSPSPSFVDDKWLGRMINLRVPFSKGGHHCQHYKYEEMRQKLIRALFLLRLTIDGHPPPTRNHAAEALSDMADVLTISVIWGLWYVIYSKLYGKQIMRMSCRQNTRLRSDMAFKGSNL